MSGTVRQRRFEEIPSAVPETVQALSDDHPAMLLGEPLFERSVVSVEPDTNIFVSGTNNRKIGRIVTRGQWRGFPIFVLTLPERKTCPSECVMLKTCYGNAMPFARRHEAGAELENRIRAEIPRLSKRYPNGFVVRLHILGDFYSVDYVRLWGDMLRQHPPLHVYGYTSRAQGADALSAAITKSVKKAKDEFGQRFSIRWSMPRSVPDGATVIDRLPEGANVPEGLVCPAEREATACCATCGLCWEAPGKTIVFMRHGMGSKAIDRVVSEANKSDDTGLRQIRPLPGVKDLAGEIRTRVPQVVWLDPKDLYVDETYQRNLSRKSMQLISKIVTGFSWAHYKPPIVAKDGRSKVMFVIDGQHTAIAAASHPDIKKIPVFLVEATEVSSRARGFIAHNKDRIAMTAMQLHHSSVVAGDPEAIEIATTCERAGVSIVRFPPPGGFGPRETMALTSVKTLLRTIGSAKAISVLKVLASADLAPIRSDQIKAVARLLYSSEFEGEVTAQELKAMLSSISHDQVAIKARDLAASTAQRQWEALATVYFQTIKKRRQQIQREAAAA